MPKDPTRHEGELLAIMRRRLAFRARHRGLKEADFLLGQFADLYLEQWQIKDLRNFEQLLEEDDAIIYDWLSGTSPIPAHHRHNVALALVKFYREINYSTEHAPKDV
jgi:antitoxin CptB